MNAHAWLPPISILSSPSLMYELITKILVEAKSMPSVLGELPGVLMVRFVTVIFALLPLSIRWNVGGFCKVRSRKRILVVLLKLIKFGRDEASGLHQPAPLPSITPN